MYNIISVPSKNIRAIAREALRGNWKLAFLGTLIYYCAISIPNTILSFFQGISGTFGLFLYTCLVTGAFAYGYSLFCLVLFRKRKADFTTIFSGFEVFTKTFVLFMMQTFFVFLWSLLFVIPGIIAGLRYSQAFYIMIDNPNYSPMQCISESKRIMNGNKTKLFCLELSFIGWTALSTIPTTLFDSLGNGTLDTVISLVLQLPAIFVMIYLMIATVVLYEMIVGNLVPRVEFAYYEPNNAHENNKDSVNADNDKDDENTY